MKNKLIRRLSPITLSVVSILDAASIWFTYIAVQKMIIKEYDAYSIMFLIIVVCVLILGIFLTKNVLTTGVKFYEDKFVFTGLDENNEFSYTDVVKVETQKDEKASLKKNFVDRYSIIILHLADDSVVSIELGLTTRKTLNKIKNEIESRMSKS